MINILRPLQEKIIQEMKHAHQVPEMSPDQERDTTNREELNSYFHSHLFHSHNISCHQSSDCIVCDACEECEEEEEEEAEECSQCSLVFHLPSIFDI